MPTMPPNKVTHPKAIRAPATKWTNEEIESLVAQVKQAKDEGKTSDSGFKSVVWTSIAASFPAGARKQDPRVCETKWSRLKKDYKEVKFLREASGFGWDSEKCVPTAEPGVWAEIQKVISTSFFYIKIYANCHK